MCPFYLSLLQICLFVHSINLFIWWCLFTKFSFFVIHHQFLMNGNIKSTASKVSRNLLCFLKNALYHSQKEFEFFYFRYFFEFQELLLENSFSTCGMWRTCMYSHCSLKIQSGTMKGTNNKSEVKKFSYHLLLKEVETDR